MHRERQGGMCACIVEGAVSSLVLGHSVNRWSGLRHAFRDRDLEAEAQRPVRLQVVASPDLNQRLDVPVQGTESRIRFP